MPQATIHGDQKPSTAEEYATSDYARSPVPDPRLGSDTRVPFRAHGHRHHSVVPVPHADLLTRVRAEPLSGCSQHNRARWERATLTLP